MRRIARHYDAELGKTGLKTTQYSMLCAVERLEPVRPVDLAASMKTTASTLTRNLQALAASGWLTIEAGPDARSRWVKLTQAGLAKRREARRHWKLAQENLNAELGINRVATLHALIDDTLACLAPAADDDLDED